MMMMIALHALRPRESNADRVRQRPDVLWCATIKLAGCLALLFTRQKLADFLAVCPASRVRRLANNYSPMSD